MLPNVMPTVHYFESTLQLDLLIRDVSEVQDNWLIDD